MQLGAMNNPRADLLHEIARIAGSGFDFVDLTVEAPGATVEGTDWDAVRTALADAGLGVVCHAAPYLPLQNPSPLVRQAALDELRRTIDIAQRLGAPLCTTHFVGWPAHLPEDAGYDFYQQAYRILVKHGAERGVQVALANSAENKHQLMHFREIFFRVPELKLTFDIGHGNVHTARSMTRDYLFALNDRLALVHLSDNDGTADDHLPFGAPPQGAIRLRHELHTLKDFHFSGKITVQVFGAQRWLLESTALIRELWAELHG